MSLFTHSFPQCMPEFSFDSHNSWCQGTSYHSCFTYKETQAQEGELFAQSHIITGRTGTWIKFSWLPGPGCLRLFSNYFNAFTEGKNCPDLVKGKAQAAFLLGYILLIQMVKDTGVSFLHQSHYTFACKALVPIMEKIIQNYIFFPLKEAKWIF